MCVSLLFSSHVQHCSRFIQYLFLVFLSRCSPPFPFFIFTNLTLSHSFCFLCCGFFSTPHLFFSCSVIFKEVNTCNPATITGTLSRISLDDDEDPKLQAHQEGGVNFSALPGNIPPPNLIVQVNWIKKKQNTLQIENVALNLIKFQVFVY